MGFCLRCSGDLLPPAHREWPDAMLAELEAIPDSVERHRFAAGCVRPLVVDVVATRLRSWPTHPQTLALALGAGFAIAMLDQASDTRRPMWIALGATSALFAWWRPVAAWRWGLLLATGIPLLAAVSDTRGPYAFDQADAMYGIVPAILVAMVVGFCRRLVRRFTISLVAVGLALALAALAFAGVIFSTPQIGAAEHLRSGLGTVLLLLSAAGVLCGALPLATFLGWRRGTESLAGRVTLCLLSAAGVVAAVLLWHYRLVGFHL